MSRRHRIKKRERYIAYWSSWSFSLEIKARALIDMIPGFAMPTPTGLPRKDFENIVSTYKALLKRRHYHNEKETHQTEEKAPSQSFP